MHDWFAAPIARQRSQAMRDRAAAHRTRIALGRDAVALASTPVVALGAHVARQLDRRRVVAGAPVEAGPRARAVVAGPRQPACC